MGLVTFAWTDFVRFTAGKRLLGKRHIPLSPFPTAEKREGFFWGLITQAVGS
jgi:hypothetical protein